MNLSNSEEIQCIVKNGISTLNTINNIHYLKIMISFKNISVDIMEFKKQLIGPTKNICIIKLVYLTIQISYKKIKIPIMGLIKKQKNDNTNINCLCWWNSIKIQLVVERLENWFNSGSFQLASKNYFDEELYLNLIQEIVRKI